MRDRYSPQPLNSFSDMRAIARQEAMAVISSQGSLSSMTPRSVPQNAVITPFVTALPVAANDGDEVRFLADGDAGIVWHLRYRGNAPSDYRWEFIGGSSLYEEVQTSEGTTSATFTVLATPGPSITLPVAGDYLVSLGAQASNSTVGAVAHISYDIGSTGAVDADGPRSTSSTASADIAISYTRRKDDLDAVALTAMYKQTAGGTATFARRWLSVTPIRVGRP